VSLEKGRLISSCWSRVYWTMSFSPEKRCLISSCWSRIYWTMSLSLAVVAIVAAGGLPLPAGAKCWLRDVWGRDGAWPTNRCESHEKTGPTPRPSPMSARFLAAPDRGWRRAIRPRTERPFSTPTGSPKTLRRRWEIRSTGSSVIAGGRFPPLTPSRRRRPTLHPGDGGWWWSGQSKSALMRAIISSAMPTRLGEPDNPPPSRRAR
jgi:hypothetical protein